ncbi:MAG: adenylosuccinate lyase, partial [Bacteroidales bacterium]|nr:adenylosuccinate lyase [Bacteroidales bacterium]
MEELNTLLAVSPVDGRYAAKTASLRQYFSECALIRYRTLVETEYFIALCSIPLPQLSDFGSGTGKTKEELFSALRKAYLDMSPEDAKKVKEIEKVTNHDVKAVEYFIKERFKDLGLERWQEFVHFGLTSQDINNTSQPLMLKDALFEEFIPALESVNGILRDYAEEWKDIPMLAKTHGQPATPTRLGKEMMVFVSRLDEQVRQLKGLPFPAKFGGATGNMNAHKVAYPGIDWPAFADGFVSSLG